MSFRIEYKYVLYPNYIFQFFEKYGEIKKIFPDRNISSIYFDNKNLDCHNLSIEGLVPRQKIRIRNYNNEEKYFLEKKINSEEGKFKTNRLISNIEKNKFLNIGMVVPKLGICSPKIIVEYNRSYFLYKKFRITIDKDITFKKYNSTKISKLTKNILEIKTNIKNSHRIKTFFPWRHSRFSKYCEAIQNLNIL